MPESYDLSDVDTLTVGTVGPPGRRTFFLQARAGSEVMTLKVEKQQVSALAQYLDRVLADLPAVEAAPSPADLHEPVEAEWAVGTLAISYDEVIDRIVLLAQEATGEDDDPAAAVARITATRAQVAALAARGAELVEAGRPLCSLCGHPLDPSGHVCPRTNGHRPPTL